MNWFVPQTRGLRRVALFAMPGLVLSTAGSGQVLPDDLQRSLEAVRVIDSMLPSLRRLHVPYADTALGNAIDNYAYLRGLEPVAIVQQWCHPNGTCNVEKFYFESGALFAGARYRDTTGPSGSRLLISGTKDLSIYRDGKLSYVIPIKGPFRAAPFNDEAREDAADIYESGMTYLRMTLGTRRIDEFRDVRCGGDVIRALRGKSMVGGRVIEIETLHQDIKLRATGGTEVNDSLFMNGWLICGREYNVLQSNVIEDAMLFPSHSVRQPGFIGLCKREGKDEPWSILAVLDNPTEFRQGMLPRTPDDTLPYAAISAWHIDEKARRFVPVDVKGLRCPRWGIFTRDGGL
jgi:hypothetical protein